LIEVKASTGTSRQVSPKGGTEETSMSFHFDGRMTLAAAAFAAVLAMPLSATAQPGPGYGPGGPPWGQGWGPGVMMGPGMMSGPRLWGRMCDPQLAGFAEWRIEQIERTVKPTEAQRAAFNDLKTASTKAAEALAAACPRDVPKTSSERLALMETRMEAMLAAVKTVRPAYDAFYATLSDEQKKRIDDVGPRWWRWHRWSER
jgi:hypothetical protein